MAISAPNASLFEPPVPFILSLSQFLPKDQHCYPPASATIRIAAFPAPYPRCSAPAGGGEGSAGLASLTPRPSVVLARRRAPVGRQISRLAIGPVWRYRTVPSRGVRAYGNTPVATAQLGGNEMSSFCHNEIIMLPLFSHTVESFVHFCS